MLKIVEIGRFACDVCKDGKMKKGVELQSYGCNIQARVVVKNAKTGDEKTTNEGHRYVWREQLHLCLKHLKLYVSEMIDELPVGGLWTIHKEAAMRRNVVNITLEEAEKRGLI